MSDNPFEAPSVQSDAAPPSAADHDADGPWRNRTNDLVSATSGNAWPRRCARCNHPDVQKRPTVVRVSDTPMILYVSLFFGIVWFFIGSYLLRKHARLPVSLCDTHARERQLWRFGRPLALLAALFGFIVLFGFSGSKLALGGMLVVLLVWLLTPSEPLRAKRIMGKRADVRGVHPEFAAALALLPGDQFEADHSDIPDLD